MNWRRFLPWRWVTRGGMGYFVMGLIVLSGAVWSFGALVEIGNVATTKQSLTTLPVPTAGYLFAGSVDLFIFYGYLKCYGPAWQIVLAVFHILVGLATSLWFQWQHSKGIVDPVAVSVVPALAVAISLDTWVVSQLVSWWNNRTRARPTWDEPAVPIGPSHPHVPADDPDPERYRGLPPSEPSEPFPEVIKPDLQSAQRRPNRQPSQRRVLSQAEQDRVAALVAEGWSAQTITRDLGLSDRHRKTLIGPLVTQLKASQNGDRP